MADYQALVERIAKARAARDNARRGIFLHDLAALEQQRRADRTARDVASERGRGSQRQPEPPAAARADLVGAASELQGAVDAGLSELWRDVTPEQLTSHLDASIPIALLPLRIETKFRDGFLLVRVFPDEIAIETHEELLTEDEVQSGKGYWQAVQQAAGDDAAKAAWRSLVLQFGAPRAAYVARRTLPLNWVAPKPEGSVELQFAQFDKLKSDSWTEAPRVHVLPDRLMLRLMRGESKIIEALGNVIPDVVHAGPKPLGSDGQASWSRDEHGELVFDAESLWLKDFDEAVRVGLGFKITLSGDTGTEFSELIVLGLKYSAGADGAKELLEQLFEGHRYAVKGLAILPQGAATNNTSGTEGHLDRADDFADVSYAALNDPASPPLDFDAATDSQRLAAYLGLSSETFARLPGSQVSDHAEAVAMNKALFPGTAGYFLRSILPGVVSDGGIEELRAFFTRFVTGRGALPALRIGNQPYGFVLSGPPPRLFNEPQAGRFDIALEHVLARLRSFWKDLLPTVGRLGATADSSADLLKVLGQQPSSAAFYQRMAVTYDHLANLADFQLGGDRAGDVFDLAFKDMAALSLLQSLGYRPPGNGDGRPWPVLFQLIYQTHQTRFEPPSLIDGLPFSETAPIAPYDAATGRNYIDWLLQNARNPDALRRQDFGSAPRPTSVLYMLLRHALLCQTSLSIERLLTARQISALELTRTRSFQNFSPKADVAVWDIMRFPAKHVITNQPTDLPLFAYVHLPEFKSGPEAAIGAPLDEMMSAYPVLRGLPTARLERAFTEHLDLLGYRIDAWETGLSEQRLRRRQMQADKPRGIFLGAFGYLENVKPSTQKGQKVSEDILPEEMRLGQDNLYRQGNLAGHVHAPSLNHATAAALLRNGYLTHSTKDNPGLLASNVSSRRVRKAHDLMSGIQHGQPLEVLLGIVFERGMHDFTTRSPNPLVLNDLKPALRQAFPIQKTRIPPAGHPSDQPAMQPDYSVVNGLAIAQSAATFPAGVAGLPSPLAADKLAALQQLKDGLRDALDALNDIMIAESAYQLALGNFDRSAAVVQSLGNITSPPDIQVTGTVSATEMSFTQRLSLTFDSSESGNPWPAIAMSRAARTEAPLNHWLGKLFGAPDLLSCRVKLTETSGAATATTDVAVNVSELGMQPVDLLRLLRTPADRDGAGELELRIRELALGKAGMSDAARTELFFTETGPAAPAAARPMGLALHIGELAGRIVSAARPLDGRDSLSASTFPSGTEPTGIDLIELKARFNAVKADFDAIKAAIDGALSAAKLPSATPADIVALRKAVRSASDIGLDACFPASGATADVLALGEYAATRLSTLLPGAADQAAKASDATLSVARRAELLTGAIEALLGPSVKVMPRFVFPNVAEITLCDMATDQILAFARAADPDADPVRDVLSSVAQVRPQVQAAHRLMLIEDLQTAAGSELVALQIPPRNNDTWLGTEFPADWKIYHSTVSCMQFRPQGFKATDPQCGLMIDEWVEVFPQRTAVTGLAFGYDQPNSKPPQAVILAVAGDDEKAWSWEGLVAILRDTMLRARMRAVEPDLLEKVPQLAAVLPGVVAETSESLLGLSLDFGAAHPVILKELLASGYLSPLIAEPT